MPRSFSHLTPRYIIDRTREKIYRRSHPGLPWFSPQAIAFLREYLLPTDEGLEFGSGRSTIWFARRIHHLTSVEHNADWAARVREMLAAESITNVDLIHHPRVEGSNPDIAHTAYVSVTSSFKPQSIDFAIIDGIYRAQCTLRCLPLLKSHAVLIIDNVNKYLPSESIAPNSRSLEQGPAGADWNEVWQIIQPWRRYWTGNGVSDTAFFFKP